MEFILEVKDLKSVVFILQAGFDIEAPLERLRLNA